MFNPKGWKAKPVCFKNNHKCHHEKAPRGSNTGTQGAINVFEAGKIPDELCDEIILSTKLKSISE